MKTFSLLLILAVAAALVLLPISLEIVSSLLFVVGMIAILRGDYGRKVANATEVALANRRAESLRLAA